MNRLGPRDNIPDFKPSLIIGDRLDETVVTIPCYEPAGQRLELSGRDVVTHTILLGASGSGKTSVLNWIIKSLINHGTDDSKYRPGVFIFDLNGGDTPGLVRKWAAECGRSQDVCFLTADTGYFDLFANIRTFADLPSATSHFMHGGWVDASDNGYWHETARSLIDAALSIILVVSGRLETDEAIRFLTNWLVAKRASPEDESLLARFEAMVTAAPKYLDKQLLSKLDLVRATVEMWNKLDSKTKGILNSCLLDALGPLTSLDTRRYLDCSRGSSFIPEEVVMGKIMVFSIAAGRNLESALLLGRLLKSRLYLALQDRPQSRDQRLCCVIADEYHYLASGGVDRSSDVTALATLRSRAVGIVAASQSLNHLASVMTAHQLRSLLPNFGNHVFFRSTEDSTGGLATAVMGTQQAARDSTDDPGDLMEGPTRPSPPKYICPPGALTKLLPCQAYVSLSTGYRSPGMIWLAGNHETPGPSMEPHPLPLADPLAVLRESLFPPPKSKPSPAVPKPEVVTADWPYTNPRFHYDEPTWYRLLSERRFQRSSYSSLRAFQRDLANRGQKPEGLESLPICWWDALARMVMIFAHQHPMRLLSLHEREGCLEVMISDLTHPTPLYLEWIARLQASIYPTRTRPLKRRDKRLLNNWEHEEDYPVDADDPQEEGEG